MGPILAASLREFFLACENPPGVPTAHYYLRSFHFATYRANPAYGTGSTARCTGAAALLIQSSFRLTAFPATVSQKNRRHPPLLLSR